MKTIPYLKDYMRREFGTYPHAYINANIKSILRESVKTADFAFYSLRRALDDIKRDMKKYLSDIFVGE